MQSLLEHGIASKRGVMCSHRSPVYAGLQNVAAENSRTCSCPPGECVGLCESERAEDRSLMLPMYPSLSEADQDRVVEVLKMAVGAGDPRR
jgi:perosamine synthetase